MADTVTVNIHEYASLLIKAGVTDEAQWPESIRHGARLLARIREIESDCRKLHGKWDWEKISEALQDEYDGLCQDLNRLRDPGIDERWEQLKSQRRAELSR